MKMIISRIINLIRNERKCNFSTFTLVAHIVFFIAPNTNMILHLRGISYTCLIGNAISFYMADIVFPLSHTRMATKLGLEMTEFHILNALYHIAPIFLPTTMIKNILTSALAIILHGSWGYWVSGGTMNLNSVYVPVPSWVFLWLIAFTAEGLTALSH